MVLTNEGLNRVRDMVDSDISSLSLGTNYITIDNCETADWTDSTDATSLLDISKIKQGTNSLELQKDGTTETFAKFSKDHTTERDFTGKTIYVWLYITNLSDLLTSGTAVNIIYSSDSDGASNYYQYDVDLSNLSTGWNNISFTSATASSTTGTPDIDAMRYTSIQLNVDLAADTIAANQIFMDWWRLSGTTASADDTDLIDTDTNSTKSVTSSLTDKQIKFDYELLSTEGTTGNYREMKLHNGSYDYDRVVFTGFDWTKDGTNEISISKRYFIRAV
jgi:hypothetical protein